MTTKEKGRIMRKLSEKATDKLDALVTAAQDYQQSLEALSDAICDAANALRGCEQRNIADELEGLEPDLTPGERLESLASDLLEEGWESEA